MPPGPLNGVRMATIVTDQSLASRVVAVIGTALLARETMIGFRHTTSSTFELERPKVAFANSDIARQRPKVPGYKNQHIRTETRPSEPPNPNFGGVVALLKIAPKSDSAPLK